MTRSFVCAAALAGFLLYPPPQAFAHSGGTDRHGCHTEHRTGDYHCHNRKDEDRDMNWAVIGGVAGGALLLWVIVKQFDRDDPAAAERLRIVPRLVEGNRMGIAAEYALGGAGRIGLRAVPPATGGHGDARVGAWWRLGF